MLDAHFMGAFEVCAVRAVCASPFGACCETYSLAFTQRRAGGFCGIPGISDRDRSVAFEADPLSVGLAGPSRSGFRAVGQAGPAAAGRDCIG